MYRWKKPDIWTSPLARLLCFSAATDLPRRNFNLGRGNADSKQIPVTCRQPAPASRYPVSHLPCFPHLLWSFCTRPPHTKLFLSLAKPALVSLHPPHQKPERIVIGMQTAFSYHVVALHPETRLPVPFNFILLPPHPAVLAAFWFTHSSWPAVQEHVHTQKAPP